MQRGWVLAPENQTTAAREIVAVDGLLVPVGRAESCRRPYESAYPA